MTDAVQRRAPRRHGETRELILDAAQQMVQTDSYDGFSFRDIADAVGIRKASVYHHFESKEALAAAMADRTRERFGEWAANQSARPAPERLQAYCYELYGDYLGAGMRLCPGASLIAGWSHLPPDVRGSVLEMLSLHMAFLTAAMRDGGGDGTLALPAGCDPETAARWFACTVQGALIWARASGSREEFEKLCRITLKEFSAA